MDTSNLKLEDLPEAVSEILSRLKWLEDKVDNLAQDSLKKSIFSTKEASEFLQFSTGTIYKKVSNNEIPYHKKEGSLYFSKEELKDWLKGDTNHEQIWG